MFELRWVKKKTGQKLMNEIGYHYDEIIYVLQSRQKYQQTIYGSSEHVENRSPEYRKELVWSEWTDVSIIDEENV